MIANQIVAVFGKKGSGKSRWVKAYAQRATKPVVVFDVMDEYSEQGACRSDPLPRCLRFHEDDSASGLRRFLDYIERTGRIPERSAIVARPEDFDTLCRWSMRQGQVLLIVEEADCYVSPSKLSKAGADLLRRGRHVGVDQVWVSRVPSEIHRDVTRNADLEVYFQLQEGIDHDWVRKRCGDSVLDRVRNLKPRTCFERRG